MAHMEDSMSSLKRRAALLCLIFCLTGLWGPCAVAQDLPSDFVAVAPNDNAPAERQLPVYRLPALPASEESTIRRVNVGDTKVVAITFDLCERSSRVAGYNREIIEFLRQQRVPATFFMSGKWMRSHKSRVLDMLPDPLFEIGNHGWTHGNLALMDKEAVQRQLRWTQGEYELLCEELQNQKCAVGSLPQALTLVRLPYGRCTDEALNTLAQEGLRIIQWDVLGEPLPDNTPPEVADRVVQDVRPGSILLFHANRVPKGSVDSLRRTVALLRQQGYAFVKVSELLAMGQPERTKDGYFVTPGDNIHLDTMFGPDGTIDLGYSK